ncbi:MAG TPA: amidase [Vicinamibacterales bacterium]|nr:amidase [Vicinamibacterales bacterium]
MPSELCFTSARELAAMIRARAVSAREVMQACLEQIARLNPTVNAIVARLPDEQCLALAEDADSRMASGAPLGPLHGLPVAFKDAEPATGFPFTRGSRIFKDDRPAADSVIVERLRLAGVIPVGKTNVSEFTMGSHTYNEVYGTTLNPWDPSRSAGGSSGGAAAAVASGMLPLADGSDLGGSLRNPASFNNLVALRPTVGLVPNAPVAFPLIEFLAKGPLARSVDDAAFMLSVMAGADARDPRTWPSEPELFARLAARSARGVRVAWCPDLGGLPLDRRVRTVVDRQRGIFTALGCRVEDAAPDLRDADDVFMTLRSWMSAHTLGPLLATHRELMKPEAIWQIEAGLRVTASALARAFRLHAELLERMRVFHEGFDFIVCAVSQVPPFDARIHWPDVVDGQPMEHYIAWMRSTYWISTILAPALSVPAGFTDDGLPVGIQIVGRMRDDVAVLQLGSAFEAATRHGLRHPPIATAG